MSKLKELRTKHNLRQEDLAKVLKVTQRTYSGYELGQTEPNSQTLIRLADFYQVSVDYILDHEIQDNIDTSAFSYTKKECVAKIKELSEDNANVLLGYLTHILQTQKK